MDREKLLKGSSNENLFKQFQTLYQSLDNAFIEQFNRSIPLEETLIDRWERAKKLGFGEGSSVYSSAFVFGKCKVGKNCWIGPYVILDGSGQLEIGDHCTISVGVHVYTHDNVAATLTGGSAPIDRGRISIGSNTYLGPQCILAKNITIGSRCILGANSFLNTDMPDGSVFAGNPARRIGTVVVEKDSIRIEYQS